jgi:hypothetical protein
VDEYNLLFSLISSFILIHSLSITPTNFFYFLDFVILIKMNYLFYSIILLFLNIPYIDNESKYEIIIILPTLFFLNMKLITFYVRYISYSFNLVHVAMVVVTTSVLICDNEEKKRCTIKRKKKGVIHFPNPKL